jgi:hypothetical protein
VDAGRVDGAGREQNEEMKLRRFFQVALLGILIVLEAHAQPKWQVYTPSSKTFSVDLPWKPINRRRNLQYLISEQGTLQNLPRFDKLTPAVFKGTSIDDWYDLSMYIDESSTFFFIHVYEVRSKRSNEEFDSEVREIMRVDTCKSCRFATDEPVVVNGFSGRQIIYQRGKESGRVLFINGGDKLYTLSFQTEDKKGVDRGAVNRVFGTFHPTP